MGMAISKKLEELATFDAFITLEFEQYEILDLKVGDIVEIEISTLNTDRIGFDLS